MCGIAGVVGLPVNVAQPRVKEALRRLRHRGPDGEGWYCADGVVLGMRRLAIIDLETGDQPIFNEDRSLVALCNGEIYNYVEQFAALRSRGHRLQSGSDVNAIPHLFEEMGAQSVQELRGMFAACVWDTRRQRLTLFRDRAGKKPLYYSHRHGVLAFASELPALVALLDEAPNHSPAALAAYLPLGFVPQPATIYEGVFSLPPGGVLEHSLGEGPVIRTYWAPVAPMPFKGTRDDALARLDDQIGESVAIRLRSDVPVGLFLSGGIDSSLVAAYAVARGAKDLMCFVVEVPDESLNEAPAAKLVAQHLGLPVETIPLTFTPIEAIERIPFLYGQPFGDSSAVPSYFVAAAAARVRKVVLNGDGGDELFGGYRRYWLGRVAPWLVPLARAFRRPLRRTGVSIASLSQRRSSAGFLARALRGLGTDETGRYLIWTVDLLGDQDVRRCFPELAQEGALHELMRDLQCPPLLCHDLRSLQWTDFRVILAGDLLPKMDIATMANSVEARSPFLDASLAEFSWSLPPSWIVNLRETKPLLRTLARSRLPIGIADAPKRGFEAPVARWLREDLRDVLHDTLLSPGSRVATLGDRTTIRSLVRGEDDFAGNRPQVVWSLLMLELFLRAPGPAPAVPRVA